MSSSEDYLDSLLDSILGGGKPDDEEKSASKETESASAENKASTEAGKAMSPDEIEEMLVSMGSLDGGEDQPQEEDASEMDEMEAMLAFMNEHNASVAEEKQESALSLDDLDLGEDDFSYASVDGLTSEESGTDEMASDGLADLSLDDLSLDSLDLGEDALPDEGLDAFSLDDLSSEEEDASDFSSNDFSLDDLDLGEDGLLEESGMDESSQDDMSDFDSDSLSLDDFSLDDLDLGEESVPEEIAADESIQGGMSDFDPDSLSLDEFSLDDLDLGEESVPEEIAAGESGQDDASDFDLDNFSLDDLSLDDLDLGEDSLSEESGQDDMDGQMSVEEIDRLLNGNMSFEEEPSLSDDLALEESGEDDDLAALLAGMDHDDDLSEIHDLLGESEQGVSADDDMLAMLEGAGGDSGFDFFENDEAAREAEGIRELTPEEIAAREGGEEQGKTKKKKKRKKLFGKKKGGDEEQPVEEMGTELEDLLGEVSAQEPGEEKQKEKKPGLAARILDFLLESDEDDEDPLAAEVLAGNGGAMGNLSGENRALLDELNEEDKKGKKKKKDKKSKKETKEAKEAKEKKPKKVKRKKKEKKADADVDLFAPPEKRLSKKKVFVVFLFCGTILACIILGTSILPEYMQQQEARLAYDKKDYAEVFDLLYGKELDEQDEVLFQRSRLVLQMSRKLSSYENYLSLDMRLEALDALISGVERYHQVLAEAETYNVVGEVSDIYVQILGRLSADFGVSEADAVDIINSEDDVIYSQKLLDILNGAYAGEAGMSGGRQDVLLEEEEIIERIDGLEEEAPDAMPEEEMNDSQPEEDTQSEEEPAADEIADEGSDM